MTGTRGDEEREDLAYTGQRDGADGDDWDAVPTCDRMATPTFPGQRNPGTCGGFIIDGRCRLCGRPPRKVER